MVSAALAAGAVGCGDKTGLGMHMCEALEDRHAGTFSGVNFSADKLTLGTDLQNAFEASLIQIPAQYPEVRADIAALRKDTTPSGKMIFTEGKNEILPESHCDMAWSCALALHAAKLFTSGPAFAEPCGRRRQDYGFEAQDFNSPNRRITNEASDWPV